MAVTAYTIFHLHGACYGLNARAVREVFYLPELTPVMDAPPDIAGILNLRGDLLPVIDLERRFGYRASSYCLSDSVIALQDGDATAGIIVSEVAEVVEIDDAAIARELSFGRPDGRPNGRPNGRAPGRSPDAPAPAQQTPDASPLPERARHFLQGIARTDDGLVSLLNPGALLRYATTADWQEVDDDTPHSPEEAANRTDAPSTSHYFCPGATPAMRETFRQRTDSLRAPAEREDFSGFVPLAALRLGGEVFAANLERVREFVRVAKLVPVPCCPPHVLGNTNLRGEIVTLIDIRRALNLPAIAPGQVEMAAIVEVDGIVAGIAIDEVLDVVRVPNQSLAPVPAAIHAGSGEYLQGVVPHEEKFMGLLNLPKLFAKGGLVVDETIA